MNNDRFNFRVWDKKYGMNYDSSYYLLSQIGILWEYGSLTPPEAINYQDQCIILQSTGLKDKNGKLIYEGDILKITYPGEDDLIKEVAWQGKDGYPAFDLEPNDHDLLCNNISYFINENYYEIEIIGNKFENPELLTKK